MWLGLVMVPWKFAPLWSPCPGEPGLCRRGTVDPGTSSLHSARGERCYSPVFCNAALRRRKTSSSVIHTVKPRPEASLPERYPIPCRESHPHEQGRKRSKGRFFSPSSHVNCCCSWFFIGLCPSIEGDQISCVIDASADQRCAASAIRVTDLIRCFISDRRESNFVCWELTGGE